MARPGLPALCGDCGRGEIRRGDGAAGYGPRMVKQGPVPAFVHGLYEYLAGAGLIVAPLLIGYDHGAATAVSIILGLLLIFLAAPPSPSTSLVNQVSLSAHVILDYVFVAVLIASPFLFS